MALALQGAGIPTFNFLQFFMFIVSLSIVIVLAIITTRLVASQKVRGFNKNIKILESVVIGNGVSICLIQTGERYALIGITKNNVTFLQDIAKDEIDIDTDVSNNIMFKKYFDKYLLRKEGEEDDTSEEK